MKSRAARERGRLDSWEPRIGRRLWRITIGVSIGFHIVFLSIASVMTGREIKIPIKLRLTEPPPPAAEFQPSPPPLQKAMSLRKRVAPKIPMARQRPQEQGKQLQYRGLASRSIGQHSPGLLSARGAMPGQSVGSGAQVGGEGVEVDIGPTAIAGLKEPEKRISMQEEFLDLEALDIGKYKGLVIQDPADKQNITGFVYLALAWGNDFKPATQRAITELVEAINKFTQIRAEVDEHLFLDSRDIFRAPFVYLTVDRAFDPTEREIENLGNYLRNGGFALVENARPEIEYSPAEASLRQLLKTALGRDARFQVIPNDHPLYHSFFDFADGPPPQRDQDSSDSGRDFSPGAPYLEGIFLGDRLVVIFSNKAYGKAWEKEYRNEPQLQIGVNMVVFALTQQGSIAQQQIDFYKEASQ